MLDEALRLRNAAEAARHEGDLPRAHELYGRAVSMLRDSDRQFLLAHTVRHLGDVYADLCDWKNAEPCYSEALAIYRAAPDPPPLDKANAIRSMAVLKEQTGAIEEALALWQEARDLYAALEIAEGVAGTSSHIARLT